MMAGRKQISHSRLTYHSHSSESEESEELPKLPADIVSYLAVASAWQIDIIPYTWLPSLGNVGEGQSGTIQQSIANLQTSFAFKTFDHLLSGDAFEQATSEIRVLGNPKIRDHPNIIDLEGICWSIQPGGEVLPVLVFEKTSLGSLSCFIEARSSDPISTETRLHLSVDVMRAVAGLHSCCIYHGDIKPQNILLFESADTPLTAKITDFGFAVVNPGDCTFRPNGGTKRWVDPDYHYNSEWSFSRAKGADMYSLGLLLLWIIFHDDPNAPEISNRLHCGEQKGQLQPWPDQIPPWMCTLINDLALPRRTNGALKLIHLICFMPDPEKRALPLDIRSLRSRSVDDEDMKIAIHWLESMSSCNDNATMEPLEVLIALLEEQCLPSRARNYPSSDANFSWPLDGDGQFTLFDIATPLYNAHIHVRASVTDSLLCRVEESQNPSEYDRANLAMCFQLGFGVERNEEKSVGLMSCLDPNTVAITEANLEDFKKTYRYQYYNDSKFRTALKLGHLDSIDLAQIYASSANVEEVEDRCKRERSYVESVLGETHHIACTLASTLASLYYVREKLESAASLQRFVLDTYHSKYGKASRHTQSAKLNLAATLREDCQYPQAEALYNEVFTLRSKELGTNHVDTLLVHSDLATMYLARGKWIEAEVSLREVVRQSVAVLGVHHPHSIFVRGNYASALQNNSKLSEAEKEQETVLGASMIIYGESNIDTFTSISNLMSIYNDGCFVHQKSGEHLTRTERATQTAEKLLGLNSTLTLKMLTCLAQAYIVRGAYQQANDILDKAINASEKNKGKTHPDTISMRGTVIHVLYKQDKLKEAESLSLLLLADMDEQENLDYPIVLRNLAAIYFGQMRYTEAVGVASKYYNMQLIRHSKKHPSTSAARDLLSKYQGAAAMETTAGCFE